MTKLPEARHLALAFLDKAGSDCVGVIDSDEKLAGAMLYDGMRRDGLLIASVGDDGPVYRLTPAGSAALRALRGEGGAVDSGESGG